MYNREFRVDKNGVDITSGLKTDGKNQFQDLWAMIPFHTGHKSADARIEFRVQRKWTPATEKPVETDQIRISRYGKFTYLALATPHRAQVGSDDKANTFGGAAIRNVMIDLTSDKTNPSVR